MDAIKKGTIGLVAQYKIVLVDFEIVLIVT